MTKIPLKGKFTILPLMHRNDHFTPRGRLIDECILFVWLYWVGNFAYTKPLWHHILHGVGILIWRKYCTGGSATFTVTDGSATITVIGGFATLTVTGSSTALLLLAAMLQYWCAGWVGPFYPHMVWWLVRVVCWLDWGCIFVLYWYCNGLRPTLYYYWIRLRPRLLLHILLTER